MSKILLCENIVVNSSILHYSTIYIPPHYIKCYTISIPYVKDMLLKFYFGYMLINLNIFVNK